MIINENVIIQYLNELLDTYFDANERKHLVNNEDKRFVKYLTWRPGAFGSTPESKIAITVPRPSYCGYLLRKEIAAVSRLGSRS